MDSSSSGMLADIAPPIERFTYRGRQQFLEIFDSKFHAFTQDQISDACEFILFDINEQDCSLAVYLISE